ncbi:MAG: hypothetical protein R2751_13430 [Bacteroidales bacterium]
MKRRIGWIVGCLLAGGLGLQAQNRLDEQGRKTGAWVVEYPNGKTRYTATFREGRPVGEMLRYDEKGALQARMMFGEDGTRNYTHMYYRNKQTAAEGWYVGQEKDSVWTYYSEFDGSVRFREPYIAGKRWGTVVHYFQSGLVSEELDYAEDVRHGTWRQYHTDGSLRLTGHYDRDRLDGPYAVYYPDSTLKVEGQYLGDKAHGQWRYYDEDGTELYTIEFREGNATDQKRYLEMMQDSLDRMIPPGEPLETTPDDPGSFLPGGMPPVRKP